jgi:hypothetical protein
MERMNADIWYEAKYQVFGNCEACARTLAHSCDFQHAILLAGIRAQAQCRQQPACTYNLAVALIQAGGWQAGRLSGEQ